MYMVKEPISRTCTNHLFYCVTRLHDEVTRIHFKIPQPYLYEHRAMLQDQGRY